LADILTNKDRTSECTRVRYNCPWGVPTPLKSELRASKESNLGSLTHECIREETCQGVHQLVVHSIFQNPTYIDYADVGVMYLCGSCFHKREKSVGEQERAQMTGGNRLTGQKIGGDAMSIRRDLLDSHIIREALRGTAIGTESNKKLLILEPMIKKKTPPHFPALLTACKNQAIFLRELKFSKRTQDVQSLLAGQDKFCCFLCFARICQIEVQPDNIP
jgi:hypothetical protein